jgi:flagellar motor switch protein FliN/FliY
MEQDVGKPNQKEMNAGAGEQGPSPGGGGLKEVPNLDFILDIPLEVSVELGRARMLISDLLQLGQGSVIELNKLAGEPVEIFINQRLIARGEVVVVNDKFGIKMTDILSPMERVKQLGT